MAVARLLNILLIDDNPGDVRLAKEVLKESPHIAGIHVAVDGEEAVAVLRSAGRGTVRPDLIILDLNLPRKDGREVLREIKSDPALHYIPVIVFTSSKAEKDVLNAYELHANCYITKAVDLISAERLLKSIESFWFDTATLPHTKEETTYDVQ
jgi:CheY-like chemotaxis protein